MKIQVLNILMIATAVTVLCNCGGSGRLSDARNMTDDGFILPDIVSDNKIDPCAEVVCSDDETCSPSTGECEATVEDVSDDTADTPVAGDITEDMSDVGDDLDSTIEGDTPGISDEDQDDGETPDEDAELTNSDIKGLLDNIERSKQTFLGHYHDCAWDYAKIVGVVDSMKGLLEILYASDRTRILAINKIKDIALSINMNIRLDKTSTWEECTVVFDEMIRMARIFRKNSCQSK